MWNYIGLLVRILLAIPPVFVFLWALRLLDNYKLITRKKILQSLVYGLMAACVCYAIDTAIFSAFPRQADWHAKLGAPIVEELAKAAWVIWLIRRSRLAFAIDAAICGFAVGAGFAFAENIYYLDVLQDSHLAVWVLRGFGTAIMHGGATAMVGIVLVQAPDLNPLQHTLRLLSGLPLAIAIHAAWNLAVLSPAAESMAVLLGLPCLFVAIFMESEKSLHRWMDDKLDQDLEFMDIIGTGVFPDTHSGKYLRSLQQSFPAAVFADMLRILQLSAELSGVSKGNIIRRSAGMMSGFHPAIASMLTEISTLEARIGPAARRALSPLRFNSSRDQWQFLR